MKTFTLWGIGAILTGVLVVVSPIAAILVAIAVMLTDYHLRSQ
jgi:hypothetical protein